MSVLMFCQRCGKDFEVVEKMAPASKCQKCGDGLVVKAASSVSEGTHSSTANDDTDRPKRVEVSEPPGKIGDYTLLGKLGEGSFGIVYLAEHSYTKRKEAVKILRSDALSDRKVADRFISEAQAQAQLKHDNIVEVVTAGWDGPRCYISMHFVSGGTLHETLKHEKKISLQRTVEIISALAEALAHAHQNHITHRDVKPRNILMDKSGRPKLTDFGLAKLHDASAAASREPKGTAIYMAPEVCQGTHADLTDDTRFACDQYSLGITMYELLCGCVPFDGPAYHLMHCHIHTEPKRPREHNPDIPRELEAICLKAISKRPQDRYVNCKAMAVDLLCWLNGKPVSVDPRPATSDEFRTSTSWMWFPTQRMIHARLSTPAATYLRVELGEHFLGELCPGSTVGVFRLPASVAPPFAVRILSSRDSRVEHEADFKSLSPLSPTMDAKGVLKWQMGQWEKVIIHATGWDERGKAKLELSRGLEVKAGKSSAKLPSEWLNLDDLVLVVTPVSSDGDLGPGESVRKSAKAVFRVPGLRGHWLSGELSETAQSDLTEAMKAAPLVVVHRFLKVLSRWDQNGRDVFRDLVCAAHNQPKSWLGFWNAYLAQPAAISLLQSRLKLARLVKHCVSMRSWSSISSGPWSMAQLVVLSLSGGEDPELQTFLDRYGGTSLEVDQWEIDFWVDLAVDLITKRDITAWQREGSALRRVRLKHRCAVSWDDAPSFSRLLDEIESSPTDSLAEKLLLPSGDAPLCVAVAEAVKAHQAARSIPVTPAQLLASRQAAERVRSELASHLEQLADTRPNPSPVSWQPFARVAARLEATKDLREAVESLLQFDQSRDDAVDLPMVAPPCLLRPDLAMLRVHRQEEQRCNQTLMRVAGWLKHLADKHDIVSVQDCELIDAHDFTTQVIPSWQHILSCEFLPRLPRALFGEIDSTRTLTRLDLELERIGKSLAKSLPSPLLTAVNTVRHSLQSYLNIAALWMQQNALRETAVRRLAELRDTTGRCREARARGAALLDQLQETLLGPVEAWDGLIRTWKSIEAIAAEEEKSVEIWKTLLDRTPADMLRRFELPEFTQDMRLDPILDALEARMSSFDLDFAVEIQEARELRASQKHLLERWKVSIQKQEPRQTLGGLVSPDVGGLSFSKLKERIEHWFELEHNKGYCVLAESALREFVRRRLEESAGKLGADVDPQSHLEHFTRLLANGDVGAFEDQMEFLERLLTFLRDRADCLCMRRQPTLVDLVVGFPMAIRWIRSAEHAGLVEAVTALAQTSPHAKNYLDDRERFPAAEAALKAVRDCGQNERRWWSKLHRDLCDVLRGKLTHLPMRNAWSPPHIVHHRDLVKGMLWLRRIGDARTAGTSLPADLVTALVDEELLPA